jgi:hypothetical protein
VPRRPPIIRDHFPIARTCTRWLNDHDCGKEAVGHVIWDSTMENGFVCAEHLKELGAIWEYLAVHLVGPDCGMPGSFFFEEENVCRCPNELLPAEELDISMCTVV